jgi:4-amino-4-deoxy-L-arabinose transferase-like glycosyltransferase
MAPGNTSRFLRFLPWGVVAAGLAFQVFLAFSPLPLLLTELVPDDAFYYFQIARNIVGGLGSTFDGVNMTNGYHPLWMLVLLPVFAMFSVGGTADVAPVHAALVVGALLSAATGALLLAVMRRYTDDTRIHAFALFLWFFNPHVIYESLNGLETPLSLFLLAALLLSLVRWREAQTPSRLAALGIIGGLAMLARLDNALYIAAALAWILWRDRTAHGLRHALVAGFAAALVVAPWFMWNALTLGMFFTSASVTATVVNHALVYQDNGAGLFQTLKAAVYTTDHALRATLAQTGAPAAFLLLAGAALWQWLADRRERSSKDTPAEGAFAFGFALVFMANAAIRWTMRSWYFIAVAFAPPLLAAWFLARMSRRARVPSLVLVAAALVIAGVFFVNWERDLHQRQRAQAEMYAAAQWLNDNAPDGTVIGVFNAGVQGYFSRHRVINLDGLVNNAASAAIVDGRLWEYIADSGVGYISDFPTYMTYRYHSFFGESDVLSHLFEIHRVSLGAHARGDDGIHIYRLIR